MWFNIHQITQGKYKIPTPLQHVTLLQIYLFLTEKGVTFETLWNTDHL